MCSSDKESEQIVAKAKQCLLEAGMPVFESRFDRGDCPNLFLSRHHTDTGDYLFYMRYDEGLRILIFSCVLPRISEEYREQVRDILTRSNESRAYYYFAPCLGCREMELRGTLYVPRSGLPERKLARVLGCIMEEMDIVHPLMIKTVEAGGKYEEYRQALDRLQKMQVTKLGKEKQEKNET